MLNSPTKLGTNITHESAMKPMTQKPIPTEKALIKTIDKRHDSTEGTCSTFSNGPDAVTSIFWRYSSKTASMSVELSESLSFPSTHFDWPSTSWPRTMDDADFAVIVNDDVSCSSSMISVLRGDIASPSRSHSRSTSSLRFDVLALCTPDLCMETIDGLLKHRSIRPAADIFGLILVAACNEGQVEDCLIGALDGFNWLYPSDESSVFVE